MKLRLLGTGNAAQVPVYNCDCTACQRAKAITTYRRGPCSALIECGEQRWLIDSGLTDLAERFPAGSLNGIFQTHYHADHVQGLLHLRWGKGNRLPVLGPQDNEGFADLYRHPGILDFSRQLKPGEIIELGDMQVVALPLIHSKPTLGYLFCAQGKHIAYLTDTVGLPASTITKLKQHPLDLVVLDCSFPPCSDTPRNHNDLNLALETLDHLQPQRSVLTHIGHDFDCWLMQAGNNLPEHVEIGWDNSVYDIN
ncbi:phosphonate metabolism protein PhnP [Alcaligenaceae bacterium]|nr:phosphonate metabolism protein PhnP [Alcaligenaceae bacterium]